MNETSWANDTQLVDDAGQQFQLAWSTNDLHRAAREIKRGARVGVIKSWGVATGGVEWPTWAATPPRGSTERAERWLTDVVPGVGTKVDFSLWKGEGGSVLLGGAPASQPRAPTRVPTNHPHMPLRGRPASWKS